MKKAKKWATICIGVICLIILLRLFLFASFYVPSNGMANSLCLGDRVLVSKVKYGIKIPFTNKKILCKQVKRGELIFFTNPLSSSSNSLFIPHTFTGTVIAQPGDTIYVTQDYIVSHTSYNNPYRKYNFKVLNRDTNQINKIAKQLEIDTNNIKVDSIYTYYRLNEYEAYLIEQQSNLQLKRDCFTQKTYPITIPQKGEVIKITPWNIALVYNTILLHEPVTKIKLNDDSIFINGEKIDSYTFSKDYVWIAVYDPSQMVDSSTYGLVPTDNIIGSPVFIWLSKQPNTSLFKGFNWKRTFSYIKS